MRTAIYELLWFFPEILIDLIWILIDAIWVSLWFVLEIVIKNFHNVFFDRLWNVWAYFWDLFLILWDLLWYIPLFIIYIWYWLIQLIAYPLDNVCVWSVDLFEALFNWILYEDYD